MPRATRWTLTASGASRTPTRRRPISCPCSPGSDRFDVWWPGQSETSQRFITGKSFELHKQKGTRTGLKRHIELTGAKVLRIDAPPLMAFPGREWTDEERLAWLARFPQIRTFKYRNSGQVAGAMYASDGLWMNEKAPLIFADDPESPFAKFAVTVNGFEYHGYHSFLWDRGTETPLTTWERVVTEEDKTINIYDWIVLPGTINCRWFADQIPVGGVPDTVEESGFFCTDDPLADRTVSVFRDTQDYKDTAGLRLHQRHFQQPCACPIAFKWKDRRRSGPLRSELATGWLGILSNSKDSG